MSGSATTTDELPAVDPQVGFTRFVWITLAFTVGVIQARLGAARCRYFPRA